MQKLEMFTVFDSKANAYLQPFFSLNSDTARREFHAAINGDGQFNKYAEDYSLFFLGSFDQDEGFIDLVDSPHHVVNAITLRELVYEEPLAAPVKLDTSKIDNATRVAEMVKANKANV